MNLLSKFDPWESVLCTCPPKLTLNPYTGCDHGCLYCYASSYVRNFADCRPKKELIARLKREAGVLNGEIVTVSNSSDPYPNVEAATGLTRSCLEILSRSNCRLQIVSKSNLVARDIDLLRRVQSMVAITITTDDDDLAKVIEPHAPPPSARLKAVEKLVQNGLPVAVRVDPIIPFVNDSPETLVRRVASLGVRHVTSSTYKVRTDNWKRLSALLPTVTDRLKSLYFDPGNRMHGYYYLQHDLRSQLMKHIRTLVIKNGMRFGTCREGLSELNTGICDGSWMFRN
ncbi:MAG TPA: radical SAM protein [Candidatus Bathyarchaeia archaeon]|nr:radical SAM protein [Candidatus Bathyarchaeia archaeon]